MSCVPNKGNLLTNRILSDLLQGLFTTSQTNSSGGHGRGLHTIGNRNGSFLPSGSCGTPTVAPKPRCWREKRPSVQSISSSTSHVTQPVVPFAFPSHSRPRRRLFRRLDRPPAHSTPTPYNHIAASRLKSPTGTSHYTNTPLCSQPIRSAITAEMGSSKPPSSPAAPSSPPAAAAEAGTHGEEAAPIIVVSVTSLPMSRSLKADQLSRIPSLKPRFKVMVTLPLDSMSNDHPQLSTSGNIRQLLKFTASVPNLPPRLSALPSCSTVRFMDAHIRISRRPSTGHLMMTSKMMGWICSMFIPAFLVNQI